MDNETPIRPGEKDHARDAHGERAGEQSPLQGRAAFLEDWDWQLVTSLNRGSCDRGKAKFGCNSETHEQVRKKWEDRRPLETTLGEVFDFLQQCHRSAPFLFFNGNTFGEIARRIMDAVFVEFPLPRRRQAASFTAHYVAGVLDRESMENGLNELAELADFKPGDKVKTLRGSAHGVIRRIQEDGRVVWTPNGSNSELIALPESLILKKDK